MRWLSSSALLGFAIGGALLAHGAEVTFTIDPERSTVTASGYAADPSYRIQQQGPGSLTTKFAGSLGVDLTASTISFLNTSAMDALVNGEWQPLAEGKPGSAPADFAGQALVVISSVKAAFRDIVITATSPAISLAQDGTFELAQLKFAFPTNSLSTFDYDAGLFGQGSKSLAGTEGTAGTGKGTLTSDGNTQTITIPLQGTFKFATLNPDDSELTMTGQIVATRSLAVPTQINQITFSGNSITIEFSSSPGSVLELQSSTDLQNWTAVNEGITSTGGGTYRYQALIEGAFKFYRVVQK